MKGCINIFFRGFMLNCIQEVKISLSRYFAFNLVVSSEKDMRHSKLLEVEKHLNLSFEVLLPTMQVTGYNAVIELIL